MMGPSGQIGQLLDVVEKLNHQKFRFELKTLYAIREWAMRKAGIDFVEGDTVVIVQDIRTDNGWRPYKESLVRGATGTVAKIDFYEGWYALVVLDRAWTVNTLPNGPTTRHWKGHAEDTPEGMEPPTEYDQEHHPQGKRKSFMLDVEWLRKYDGAPEEGDQS